MLQAYLHHCTFALTMYNHTEDSCSGPFKKIQCQNSNDSQHGGDTLEVQRCFERAFESKEAYDDCVASNTPVSLGLSLLDSPDLKGGVERCDCVCKYVEKQSTS